MSNPGQPAQTLGQEIEAELVKVWGEIEHVSENVVGVFKKSITSVWATIEPEILSFVQGVIANLATQIKAGMPLEQAITSVLNAAEAAAIPALRNMAPSILQALVASLIAAL